MNKFWFRFFPIFITVNAIGVLPVFMSFTGRLDHQKLKGRKLLCEIPMIPRLETLKKEEK